MIFLNDGKPLYKVIDGKKWVIKSRQLFGLVIYCLDNPADIRWITFDGWDSYS